MAQRPETWNVHTCLLCLKRTKRVSVMLEHIREVHRKPPRTEPFCQSELELHACEKCEFETCLRVNLKNHVDVTHSNLGIDHNLPNLLRGYWCKECDLSTFSIFIFARHVCRKARFAEDNETKPFSIYEKSIKWFECGQSSYEAKTKENLSNHTNKGINWFKCEHCAYKAKHNWCLRMHLQRKHISEENLAWFECGHCSHKANTKANLKYHVLNKHTSEEDIKWFKCEECPYKTKTKGHLKSHIKCKHQHEEEIKWFYCRHCPHKTKWKDCLKRHIMRRHTLEENIKWFSCGNCMYKTKDKWTLKKHIAGKHPETS